MVERECDAWSLRDWSERVISELETNGENQDDVFLNGLWIVVALTIVPLSVYLIVYYDCVFSI